MKQLARDSRTACEWQSFVGNQAKLQSAFKAAMSRLTVLGNDVSQMVDCSDVVRNPHHTRGSFALLKVNPM